MRRGLSDLNSCSACIRRLGYMRIEMPQDAEINLGTGMMDTSAGFNSFSVEIAAWVDSKVSR